MSDPKLIRLHIITPEGTAFDEDVRCFETCIAGGYVGILPGHSKIVSYISEKPSRISDDNGEKKLCLFNSAIICVDPKIIKVFARMFIIIDKFDRSLIQSNYEKLLSTLKTTEDGYKRLQLEAMLEFELQKLKWTS